MATVKAVATWTPELDVLRLRVDDPSVGRWRSVPLDDWGWVVALCEVDEREEETGRMAGVEIVDFLEFDCWDALPQLDLLWQVAGWEPLPLVDLLQREQRELRQRTPAKGVA